MTPEQFQTIYESKPAEILERLRAAENAVQQASSSDSPLNLKQLKNRDRKRTAYLKNWIDELKVSTQNKVIGSKAQPVQMTSLLFRDDILEFSNNGVRSIFRSAKPKKDWPDIRNNFAVSELARYFEVDSMVKYEKAIVNGVPGLIREYIVGENFSTGAEGDMGKKLSKALAEGRIPREEFYLASAFGFLVNNTDLTAPNLFITKNNQLRIFDHGSAFSGFKLLLEPVKDEKPLRIFDQYPLGYFFPKRYSKKFIDKLIALDEVGQAGGETPLITILGKHLLEEEIEVVRYLRQLLLYDARVSPH